MASDFSGKKYLVTGVGSGIGRALAIELAQSGAEVWGVSRTKSNLDSLSVRLLRFLKPILYYMMF